MGSGQSKLTPRVAAVDEKAIMEKLETLRLEDDEDDFVQVNDEAGGGGHIHHKPSGVSVSTLEEWQSRLLAHPKNRLALSALSSADPKTVLLSRSTKISTPQVFNIKIPSEGSPITNQNHSGRCWLFAATNCFRVALMQKYNLENLELSQAWPFYWDKFEKSNWFLEQVIDTAGEEMESRLVQRLFGEPLSDGGQWDMAVNLVDKYGLVPQALYPDSFNAMNSSVLNSIIYTKLRADGLRLRGMLSSSTCTATDIAAAKAKMLKEVHAILTVTLGPPPNVSEKFTWSFVDKSGEAKEVRMTPRDFAKDIYTPPPKKSFASQKVAVGTYDSSVIARLVSLVHDPRHEALTFLTVPRLGNIVGGRPVSYINVPISELKRACVDMLRAGLPVLFGSDVGQYSDSPSGVMDLDIIDYELGFNVSLLKGMTKAERLRAGESQMTHAMVLTAVHIDDEGRPVRWRVQNSWGTDRGNKGWFVMSDGWMDEFVYQAVVDPRLLGKEVRDVLEQKPIELPLWDPMGSLA